METAKGRKQISTKFNIKVVGGLMSHLDRKIKADRYVSMEEIVEALIFDEKQIPSTVLEQLKTAKIPRPKGRVSEPAFEKRRRKMVFKGWYYIYFNWLKNRKKTYGHLDGWKPLRDAEWWKGPPSERAARMVIKKFGLYKTWRSLRNFILSRK